MKTLFKIIFIFYTSFFIENSFSYEINDLWTIYSNVEKIDWYKWEYLKNNLWFLWSKYLFVSKDWKTVYWYFDKNRKTVVEKIDINFLSKLWFLWSNNSFTWNILDLNIAKWYFDENKKTKIIKIDPDYNFYLWYFWKIKDIKQKIKKKKKKRKIITKWYKEILKEYIRLNTNTFAMQRWIKLKEYNKFVDNILEIIFNWSERKRFIWDDIEKIKIEIAKTDFLNKIKVLVNNSKNINKWFKYLKTKKEKIYLKRIIIIKFFQSWMIFIFFRKR